MKAVVEAPLPDAFPVGRHDSAQRAVPTAEQVDGHPSGEWFDRAARIRRPRGGHRSRLARRRRRSRSSRSRGAVFDDGPESWRRRERWPGTPTTSGWWLLACQWRRIDQEEPFVGRTAEVGDELGSRVLAARLVRDLMRLCFLLERRDAPYGKWLGRRSRLRAARVDVGPPLLAGARRDGLSRPRSCARRAPSSDVAARHNALGVTEPRRHRRRGYFQAARSGCWAPGASSKRASRARGIRRLRALPLAGAIDQVVGLDGRPERPGATARQRAARFYADDY